MTPFSSPVGSLSWTRVLTPRVLSTIGKILYAVSGLGATLLYLERGLDGLYLVGILLSLASTVSAILWIVSYILGLVQSATPGAIIVEDGTLRIGLRTVRRDEVVSAVVVERAAMGMNLPTVEIELAGGDRVTARFADPVMARTVVDAIGFGPRGRRVRTGLATPTRRLLHLAYGLGGFVAGQIMAVVIGNLVDDGKGGWAFLGGMHTVLALAVYAVIRRLFDAPTVTVGDDGIRVERGFWRKTVPLREAEAGLGGYFLIDGERCAAVQRLALERACAMAVPAERRVPFERGGQPLEAWRVRVAQTIGNASYRGAPVTAEDARATLASADASAEERVGAALALRATGEPPERLRVASEAFADPRLRVAIEAVADGDDARADEALRKMA